MSENIVPQKFSIRVSIDPQNEAKQVVDAKPTTIKEVELSPMSYARRTNRKVSFRDIYETRSLSIDKRLLPYFDALLENGPNKTVVANQWVLKILLEAGYDIDPDVLANPIE